MSLLNVEKSRQCGECDACRALHGSECQSPKDGSADLHPVSATAEQIGPRGIPILQGISDAERFEYEKRALSLEMRAIIQVVSMVRHARDDLRAYGEQVATLKAQLAAVTEERDEARKHVAQWEMCADFARADRADLVKRAESAESALLFLREKLCPDVTVWPDVPQDVVCAILDRVREAESVAAGANRALRDALEVVHSSREFELHVSSHLQKVVAAALAAPPVADPRAEALASALAELIAYERKRHPPKMGGDQLPPSLRTRVDAGEAALDAWRGR